MTALAVAELEALPSERAVRLLALSLLDSVVEAHDRLAASDDSDALHDFREAIRRSGFLSLTNARR